MLRPLSKSTRPLREWPYPFGVNTAPPRRAQSLKKYAMVAERWAAFLRMQSLPNEGGSSVWHTALYAE